ncbi:DNA polymerase III subunit beta [Candidatus Daviesbacteria bacterium]|nr:DNA polymerase III subunit beta [Candidatus Daviesbacteria bacterium]
MRLTILQPDILPAIQSVSRSVGVRSQLPVLNNILLSAGSGKLKLSATNLEIGVVKEVKAEVDEIGEVSVPAKTLLEVVANLAGQKLELQASSDQLNITTPSFSSQINGVAASEFPVIPMGDDKVGVRIDPKILLESLPKITFSAAVDEGRPILTGILTEIKDKNLQLVATDGFRLAYMAHPVARAANFKALIPRRTFEEILRLMVEDEMDEVIISTSENQNQMIFSFGATKLSSRLIEGNFPAWEKIIPQEFKSRIVVDRAQFLKAVKLASVFAKDGANVIKLQNLPDKLTLTSEAKELGSQKSEVEAQSEGEQLTVAFNSKFLFDVLAALTVGQVIFELSGPLSAASIKPMGQDGLQYIVMPVNLTS